MQPLDKGMDMDIDALVPSGTDITPEEREHRRNAIRKFMERKKVAQLTEALRMRLSYASFKASRGYSSLPFSKLDPLVDQEIAARSPSPSVASSASMSTSLNGRPAGGKKPRGRPSSYHQGTAHQYQQQYPVGLGMKPLPGGSFSAGASPALDAFPSDVHGLPAPGSLYMALFGSTPLGSNGFSPIKHSPNLGYSPNGHTAGVRRKRTAGAAGSLPPPDSPRKHRRTTGSASFSHPPRGSSGRALQREAAEAAAILTSFLSSQESATTASPRASQSQGTKMDSQSQGTTLVNGGQSMSRTSSTSSAGLRDRKPNGLGAPFDVADIKPKVPSTPPRISTAQPAMPAMDAAETLVYLATSPSPARPPKHGSTSHAMSSAGRVLFAPTTPVQAHHSHARSQSTPNGLQSAGAAQGTPFGFSFSDFVNVSPSPAQPTSAFRGGVAAEAEGKGLAGLQAPPGIY
ncbi:hypothetical protein CALCODRAFT_488606 [Calocera cornea HHB12733]|uniref:Uncharacterized protein n=1 Tax=Calocera cornea HHB12733 TaxID=1353952 RepID=A0A165CC29_9BASI|nr:hypothetical protein CALCODRAFT_488606 [Calocera cornea HHB12733]